MDESKSGSAFVPDAGESGRGRMRQASAWLEYVQKTAHGDESALGSLYDQSSGLVYSVALRILGRPEDAEEVTLDVFTQVWRSAGAFDAARGSVPAWLITLTRSRAIDRLRSQARRGQFEELNDPPPDAAASGPSPEEATFSRQQQVLVQGALGCLAPEQREVIQLAYFSGLSHSELAERLGLPVGTVKTRIRLGMMKLRESLSLLGETPAMGGIQ
ncbi:MAG: sigma-70 family RNA polymerase sigma factor [Bryobacteraceae bacterium]